MLKVVEVTDFDFAKGTYSDEEGNTYRLPMEWAICDYCRGDGVRALGGMSFTQSEWNEACHDDDEFADRYMGGAYDKPCEDCSGSGKLRHLSGDAPEWLTQAIDSIQADQAADRYTQWQESGYGHH